jgi:hypothetical protein
MTLDAYLDDATRRPWRWGEMDCTLFCAGWAIAKSGRDPGEGIRGTYDTEAEALAIVEKAGGMQLFIGARLRGIGWKPCVHREDKPETGDIGVVKVPVGRSGDIRYLPAIRRGSMWIIRTERSGLMAATLEHIAFWRG